jgi:hypothetical protein
MALQRPFPLQAAGVTFGPDPVYGMLDDLFASGAVGASALAVIQNPAGADLSVSVAAGAAYVAVSNGGKRRVYNDANSNSGRPGAMNATDWLATFSAPDATNPRVDRVVAIVRDNNVDGGSGAYDTKFKVVAGVPTAGATLVNLSGAAAVPANSILLANVVVRANATSILTADIGSARSLAAIGGGVPASSGVPTGVSLSFRGTVAPSGYALEDGSAISRTTYAALFAAIGTTYGAGDGSTTFNLPDSRGRVDVGQGTHADVASVGLNDGNAVGSRRVKHKHVTTAVTAGSGTGAGGGIAGGTVFPAATVGPQTGAEPTDGAAYLVALKIIKT